MSQKLSNVKDLRFQAAPFINGSSFDKMSALQLKQYEVFLHDGWLELRQESKQHWIPSANVKSIACEVESDEKMQSLQKNKKS